MINDAQKFISISDFIEKAKQLGIDFGHANPNHRIRYYIKTGLLPHQVRLKVSKSNNTVGHLPVYALKLLQKIEQLKRQKFNSQDIKTIIDRERFNYEAADIGSSFVETKFAQDIIGKATLFASIILLLTVGVITGQQNKFTDNKKSTFGVGKTVTIPKQIIIPVETIYIDTQSRQILSSPNNLGIDLYSQNPRRFLLTGQNEVIDESGNIITTGVLGTSQNLINSNSGTAVLRANTTGVQIPSPKVKKESRIIVTPRTKTQGLILAVTEVKDGYYFSVEVETPINEDIQFDWLVLD